MKNRKINRNFLIMILLMCVTIGYAYLNSELKINGTTGITGNSWDVHFENVVHSPSNTITPTIAPVAEPQDKVTNLTYKITFNKPGDIYEFDVDIVNAGTIDAMIDSFISKIKIDNGEEQLVSVSSLPSYLNYYVTYKDGVRIENNHLLEADNIETITVHLEYKMDITKNELAASAGKTIELEILSDYVQATDIAINRPLGLICTFEGEMVQGAEYVNGQYTYRYKQQRTNLDTPWENISTDGWGVALTNPSSTDPVTTKLCTMINNKPIVSMSYMFHNSQTSEIDTSSFVSSDIRNIRGMFSGASKIESIDLSQFDTSNVTEMTSVFFGTSKLNDANLDNWDVRGLHSLTASGDFFTNSNVKNLSAKNWKIPSLANDWMSSSKGANTIETIDVTGWDLSLTTSISGIFANSSKLKTITGLNTWDTSNITNMYTSFTNCSQLTSLDLSNWNTSNVTSMTAMFYGTSNLSELNLDNWSFIKTNGTSGSGSFLDGSAIKNLSAKNWKIPNYFGNWISRTWASRTIETIDVTGWDLSLTTDISGIFGSSTTLQTITGLNTWDTSNLTIIDGIFTGCSSITSLDLSNWNTSNVTDMSNMFSGTSALTELNLDNWDFTKVSSTWYLLNGIGTSLNTFSARNWIVKQNFEGVLSNIDYIGSIDVTDWDLTNGRSLRELFKNSKIEKFIGFDSWDVSNITDMSYMFCSASSNIEEFDLKITNWNVSNVNKFTSMFNYFGSFSDKGSFILKNFAIDSGDSASDFVRYVGYSSDELEFTLDNVTLPYYDYSRYIFEGIGSSSTNFKAVINNLSLPRVRYMEKTFWNLGASADNIDLKITNLNAPALIDTNDAFKYFGSGSTNLKLEIINWQTPNLIDTENTFYETAEACDSLNLIITGLDTSKVTNMSNMFYETGKNSKNFKITLTDFNTSKVENMENMFYLTGQYAQTWEINGLSNLNLSKVTNMKYFMYNISDGDYVRDIGTLDIYATDITDLFYNSNVIGTLNIHNNPTTYTQALTNTSIAEGSNLTVNYTSDVTDIDNIIATRNANSNVVKGSLIN